MLCIFNQGCTESSVFAEELFQPYQKHAQMAHNSWGIHREMNKTPALKRTIPINSWQVALPLGLAVGWHWAVGSIAPITLWEVPGHFTARARSAPVEWQWNYINTRTARYIPAKLKLQSVFTHAGFIAQSCILSLVPVDLEGSFPAQPFQQPS